jgi:DNA invertase Pin-like site-specific DNA recombinase
VTHRFVAYFRVSTQKQGHSGLGLAAQRKAVADYLQVCRGAQIADYQDVESGKNDDRPALLKALQHCRMAKATLVIAKLDRLSRDAHFISTLLKSGVDFRATDMPEADAFMIRIRAAVYQEERELISKRTKAALAAAKARGVKLGNPKNLRNQAAGSVRGNARKIELADAFASSAISWVDDARAAGAQSLRQIARHLNEKGARTSRGCLWTAVQVKAVLDRQ